MLEGPAEEARQRRSGALREWRRSTAQRDKVPAYVVLSDAHLEGIALGAPASLADLARCKGIGPAKLEKYGDEILAVLESAGRLSPPHPAGTPPERPLAMYSDRRRTT